MKLGVQKVLRESDILKEKVEEAGLHKESCQTMIWNLKNHSQPIGSSGAKSSAS